MGRTNTQLKMSKLNGETLKNQIASVLAESKAKQRKFTETIELQIGLKAYDPMKDKRFAGTIKLPHCPRPNLKIGVLADAKHQDEAKAAGLDAHTAEDLKKFNKNKKIIKKFAAKYSAFLASESLIKQVPRLLGPQLSKVGKFPTPCTHADSLATKALEIRSSVKFQLKKVLGLGVAVGHVEMDEQQLLHNISMAVNFLISLLKKHWQNIRSLYIKLTMGKPMLIYG